MACKKCSVKNTDTVAAALSKCDDRTGKNLLEKDVVKRFLTYVSFDTQSNSESSSFPSTAKQKDLGKYIADEFKSLGFKNVDFDEYGYVYATVPASKGSEDKPVLAFISHMDVSEDAPSGDIHTVIKEENGKSVIRTDGKTLLGADDKAGITEMVTAAKIMLDGGLPHPEIRLVVTPDEEVGAGVDHISLEKIGAAYAYTVDGEDVGDLNCETWNAAEATAVFSGVATHPGSAYGIMKNAVLMAADFVSFIPSDKIPATTRDREGFIHVDGITADVTDAKVTVILRDFERDGLECKKNAVIAAAEKVNKKYGDGSCTVTVKDQYPNMKEYLLPDYDFLLQNVRDTYKELGITANEVPIRGGTDGSRLSAMGLPTPNLGTGGAGFHSLFENIAVEDIEASVQVIIRLASKFA